MQETIAETINKITQEHVLKTIPAFKQREKIDIHVRGKRIYSGETGFTEDLKNYVTIKGEKIKVDSFPPKARSSSSIRVPSLAKEFSAGGLLTRGRAGIGNLMNTYQPISLSITKNYFVLGPQHGKNLDLPLKIAYGFAILMTLAATLGLTIISLLTRTSPAILIAVWLIILGTILFTVFRYRKFFAEYNYLLICDLNKNSTKLDKARKILILQGNFQVGTSRDTEINGKIEIYLGDNIYLLSKPKMKYHISKSNNKQ